jgi:2-polyprenyl-3-methyl-5-hydroxy-6-metoxy-1,4-benzoquinol methylase
MSDQAWYKDWFNSPYYHLLYQHRDVDEASKFITKLIEHLQPKPNARMLDVACGKGRHSKALADMGFDVSGIDLAAESIEEAKELENEHLHFFQHDMRLPFWINYFDYAFNFFTSFGYFKTQREHDNAIRTIAQSICHNGTFVIDYLNVHYSEDHLTASEQKKIDNVNFIISRSHDETHFYKKIEIEENGKLLEFSYSEKVAKFSLGDFTDMMSYQGLQVDNVYGDYQLGHYDVRKSPRMIIIAKKVR